MFSSLIGTLALENGLILAFCIIKSYCVRKGLKQELKKSQGEINTLGVKSNSDSKGSCSSEKSASDKKNNDTKNV